MQHRTILPPLLLAAGVIAATLLTTLADDSALLVLVGPAVLAGALLAAARLRRLQVGESGVGLDALLLAIAILAAGTLVAWQDPAEMGVLIPVLGGGAALPLLALPRRAHGRCG
jgi:hypothetical protein